MTLEEKRKQYLKEKEQEKLELEMARIKKLREKEEEKARKKDERDKVRLNGYDRYDINFFI